MNIDKIRKHEKISHKKIYSEKETVVQQQWNIPRENGEVDMQTNIVTCVLRKNYLE